MSLLPSGTWSCHPLDSPDPLLPAPPGTAWFCMGGQVKAQWNRQEFVWQPVTWLTIHLWARPLRAHLLIPTPSTELLVLKPPVVCLPGFGQLLLYTLCSWWVADEAQAPDAHSHIGVIIAQPSSALCCGMLAPGGGLAAGPGQSLW